jgi:hypothetical protein
MFTQVWKKYLPVIAIMIKRSANGEQTLAMNTSDFQRAAGGRKIKYSFANLHLTNGRINNIVKHLPLAREFATVLQEDDVIGKILKKRHFEFSMNNSCELTIKDSTPPSEPETDPGESDEIENNDDTVELSVTDAP